MSVFLEHTIDTSDVDRFLEQHLSPRRLRSELADVLDEGARLSEQSAKIYAPKGRTGQLERHIESEPAEREVADLEARAGITLMPDEPDPHRGAYPEVGTGLFGDSQDFITARRPGGFMVFEINGRTIVTKRVRGQEPQHFVADAYRDLIEYLPARLELLVRNLERPG